VIGRAVTDGCVSFVEAVAMASIQPAALVGESAPWSCETGQPANLVELDWREEDGSMKIRQVIAAGVALTVEADA
jgi:hypothetical protein